MLLYPATPLCALDIIDFAVVAPLLHHQCILFYSCTQHKSGSVDFKYFADVVYHWLIAPPILSSRCHNYCLLQLVCALLLIYIASNWHMSPLFIPVAPWTPNISPTLCVIAPPIGLILNSRHHSFLVHALLLNYIASSWHMLPLSLPMARI